MAHKSYKTHKSEIMDVSEGMVTLYANVFNVRDSAGDVSMPGSFSKTIQENGHRIAHYIDHNLSVGSMIGAFQSMKEDDAGLLCESKLAIDSPIGKHVYELYKLRKSMGKPMEHSIGYNVIKSEYDTQRGVNYIKEYKLWEISTVALGANQYSIATDVKQMMGDDLTVEQLAAILEKALDMNFAPEQLRKAESQLKAMLKALEQTEPQNALGGNEPQGVTLADIEYIFSR